MTRDNEKTPPTDGYWIKVRESLGGQRDWRWTAQVYCGSEEMEDLVGVADFSRRMAIWRAMRRLKTHKKVQAIKDRPPDIIIIS